MITPKTPKIVSPQTFSSGTELSGSTDGGRPGRSRSTGPSANGPRYRAEGWDFLSPESSVASPEPTELWDVNPRSRSTPPSTRPSTLPSTLGSSWTTDASNKGLITPVTNLETPTLAAPEKVTKKFDYRDYVDPAFVASVFDPRDVVLPITLRKATWHLAEIGMLVGTAMIAKHTGVLSKAAAGLSGPAQYAIFGLLVGLEPAVMIMIMLTAYLPERSRLPEQDEEASIGQRASRTENTALVVTCHNSASEVVGTMHAALKLFNPENIFIIDNGNSPTPTDNTKEVVKNINPKINYEFVEKGCKTIAQYVGTQVGNRFGELMAIDDDVILPPEYRASSHLLNEDTHAVTYAIKAVHPDGVYSTFINCQSAEYHFADLAKLSEQTSCGVLAPHGAASYWKTETFAQVLLQHNREYKGDDVQMGDILQLQGRKLAIDASIVLETAAPTSLLGQGYNYYKQRVRNGWSEGAHVNYQNKMKTLFSSKNQGFRGTAAQKISQGMNLLSNVTDIIRLPAMALMGGNDNFWQRYAMFQALTVVPLVMYKYGKARHRPDMNVDWATIVAYPAYKTMYSACATLGAIRAFTMYYPNYQRKDTIAEMEASNHPALAGVRAHRAAQLNSIEMREIAMPDAAYTRESTYTPGATTPVNPVLLSEQDFSNWDIITAL